MVNQIKTVIVKFGIILLILVTGNKFFVTNDYNLKILSIAGSFFLVIMACYIFFGEKIKLSLPRRYVDNKYFPRLSIAAFITLSSYLFLLLFSLAAFTDNELTHGKSEYFLYFLVCIFFGASVGGTTFIVKYIFRIKNSNTSQNTPFGQR
jgi:hypothetical protein